MSEVKKLDTTSKAIYKDNYLPYIEKGISVIPDRHASKAAMIKGASAYSYKLPSTEEIEVWNNIYPETNIAIALGEVSGIIALDLDSDRTEILNVILPMLPESPVEKIGSKGFTRFFRYTGEHNQGVKFNGEMILEVISSNKKTTLPPSVHPNGSLYRWSSSLSLVDVVPAELPVLPPLLLAHIESTLKIKFPELNHDGKGKFTSGRNNTLSELCGSLIGKHLPVDEAVKELVFFDKENHTPPLFSDAEEMMHGEPFSNALMFYSNHLQTANSKHFRKNEEYEVPVTASAINHEFARSVHMGKSQKGGLEEKSNLELPNAAGALKIIQDWIISNSWIPQPDLAFSASLAVYATLLSRNFTFGGLSPNLYLLNVSPSGTGKDAPQKLIKKLLIDNGAQYLLGAGDYVSDASLMDHLASQPKRLDIMDEMGEILGTINSGGSDYNRKMAAVLAELYTVSDSLYMGRRTAEGHKGVCHRPNVNILGSTTPTGFSDGVSTKALEKGLLGRFLIFQGRGDLEATRVTHHTPLPQSAADNVQYYVHYKPVASNENTIGGIDQLVTELKATDAGNAALDVIFKEFDQLRMSTDHKEAIHPVISRLYQQMVKIVIIHAASRTTNSIPVINEIDVKFGKDTILYFLENMKVIVKKYVYDGKLDKEIKKVESIIMDVDVQHGITKRKLVGKLRNLDSRKREQIIIQLVEEGKVLVSVESRDGQNQTIYKYV